MIWCKDITQILKKTFETLVIDDIDIDDILNILKTIRFDNCKIIINGNDVVEMKTSSTESKQEAITQPS